MDSIIAQFIVKCIKCFTDHNIVATYFDKHLTLSLTELLNSVSEFCSQCDLNQKINLVLFTYDHWGADEDLLSSGTASNIEILKQLGEKYRNINFFVFTTLINMHLEFKDLPNVNILHWGDEAVLNPICFYSGMRPRNNKIYNNNSHWLYLTNNPRIARSVTVAYLLGSELESQGFIRHDPFLFEQHKSIDELFSYFDYNQHGYNALKDKKNILELGLNKIHQSLGYIKTSGTKCSNVHPLTEKENFEQHLSSWYEFSVIEIISETIFLQNTGLITEKYFNSVYGYTIPIILNVPGAIQKIRDLGFDVFDDVVDNSHDLIEDHYLRLITAIDNNRRLLIDKEYAVRKWQECRSRMDSNYQHAEHIYATSQETFINELTQFLNNKI